MRSSLFALILTAAPALAAAQTPGDLAAGAAKRFPQPVRVGSLLGQYVVKPVEAQEVLGYVGGVIPRAGGGYDMIIRYGGLWGIGSRPVAVPIEDISLLGPYVATTGITPAQLSALPTAPNPTRDAVSPDTVIKLGLTGPFH
jgi:hypothetical protein